MDEEKKSLTLEGFPKNDHRCSKNRATKPDGRWSWEKLSKVFLIHHDVFFMNFFDNNIKVNLKKRNFNDLVTKTAL